MIVLLFSFFSSVAAAEKEAADKKDHEEDPFVIDHQSARHSFNVQDLFAARNQYLELMKKYPNHARFSEVQKEFWDVNVAIIRSPLRAYRTEIYTISPKDTLGKIARKFSTTIELIKIRNHLPGHKITAGRKLSIWTGPFSIEVDKSDNTLMLKTGKEVVKVYSVSTGKNNSSPVGTFTIKDRFIDPVWFHKGEVVPAADPKNFLGTRWLGFDLPKYGIHGTIEPERIGEQVSSGCIRMRNEDVQELYDLVPNGTKVTIAD